LIETLSEALRIGQHRWAVIRHDQMHLYAPILRSSQGLREQWTYCGRLAMQPLHGSKRSELLEQDFGSLDHLFHPGNDLKSFLLLLLLIYGISQTTKGHFNSRNGVPYLMRHLERDILPDAIYACSDGRGFLETPEF